MNSNEIDRIILNYLFVMVSFGFYVYLPGLNYRNGPKLLKKS